ncbi:MAG: hypothetical protein ACK4HE_01305 [Chitinophagaceae bacterium]
MLTPSEEKFIAFWQQRREQEGGISRPIIKGFSIGLAIGLLILLALNSGFYERASMQAASKMSPLTLMMAIIIISIFSAIFFQRYQWDMKEQQYQELLAKKRRLENAAKATENAS